MTVQEQRAYVEARWVSVETRWGRIFAGHDTPTFHLKLPVIWHKSLSVIFAKSEAEAIAAAYAFTVAWEEEIRELGEEVYQMADHAHMALQRVCDLIDDGDDGEALVIYVRDVCEYTRTWVRLTAILEERNRGWKS